MAKPVLVSLVALFCVALTCNAATYMVGDTSGWDISTNLDSWEDEKTFQVGDALVFQYSSSNSICEVTRKDFISCNTTNCLRSYSNGNTTVTLSKPGTRYFVSGNRLYCMGGMKLPVVVQDDGSSSPVGAPQGQPGTGSNTQSSSKSNDPASVIPSSAVLTTAGGVGISSMACLCTVAIMAFLLQS